jgi:putative ABC transport system substrate-binding protein
MKRRDLLVLLAGAAVAPGTIRAQKPTPVIGFLSSASAEPFAGNVAAFRDGLKEAGYVEGQNLAIEFAWADGRYEKLPDLAADLVRRNVALIAAAGGAVTALAAQKATSTIPIVIAIGDDPIKFGLVSSLARPEGNITGVTLFIDVLTPKRFELLSELAPAARLAILANPKNPNADSEARAAEAAARQIGRDLLILYAGSP